MEKVTTLVWVLIAVGAFVYRMVKQMRETSARESRERPARPTGGAVPGLPATSFQELLRQMQARNAAPPVAPPAGPLPEAKRTLGGRLMPREVARPTFSQERTAVRQASLEAPATARSATTTPVSVARRASAQPRAYTEVPPEYNRPAAASRPAVPLGTTVRQLLRQPESVRAAFVLSEIFQRKY